ncbi:MAG: rhodanese-like domain-containing protein [Candidatus Nanoarchaeia archaeon]
MKTFTILLSALLLGALAGAGTTFLLNQQSEEDAIKEFYTIENAVHVSPHGIRKAMDKGTSEYLLVDLRSQQEYEKEHIISAVNIPAYKDPDTSAYGDVDRIVSSFKQIKEQNPTKKIVVYCYSIPCMTGRKVGKMLAEEDIYVKHLGIGWNEWKYYWTLWNHEHEWNLTKAEDYIVTGSEPGTPKKSNSTACAINNEFGC